MFVPLLKIMPSVYDYRLKVRIAKLYKQIRTVEHDIIYAQTPAEVSSTSQGIVSGALMRRRRLRYVRPLL